MNFLECRSLFVGLVLSLQAILKDLATCSSLRLSSDAGLLLCRSLVSRNHMAEKKGFSIL